MPTVDLRPLAPPQRHPTVFEALSGLGHGDTLELVNDHRPTPLRDQIEATRPGQYDWEDVEAGPERWTARITSRVHTVDARPLIAAGQEPFETIMAAVADVGPGEVLAVIAPFEPVPLEGVLSAQGFTYEVEELGDGDWRVAFTRAS
jgi:uncharacterized protein (DUF2249 family)